MKKMNSTDTVHAHRVQLTWQILVPVLLATSLLLAGGVLAVVGGGTGIRAWADVALILLIAPGLLLALGLLAGLASAIYGMTRLLHGLPAYSGKAIALLDRISSFNRAVADGAVKPLFLMKRGGAGIRRLFLRK